MFKNIEDSREHTLGRARYARERSIAVSPVAALPHKTRFHELAHVVLGHTTESATLTDDEPTPQSLREVEAEVVAMLCCAALNLPGAAESRGYIQHWGGSNPIAVQTVATVLALVAAGVYVVFTYLLWRQNHRSQQAVLMQQLMVEYDGLRESIQTLQALFLEPASAGADPVQRFADATSGDFMTEEVQYVDAARSVVSRFFVKIRKLSLAGFLERRIIVLALSRAPMEDVFLRLVDPLDQVIAERTVAGRNVTDRHFFETLVQNRDRLARLSGWDRLRT